MLRPVTKLALLCSLLALALAPAALARDGRGEAGQPDVRGIVQSVSAHSLDVRTLDGATLTVRVDGRTRVTVNGRRAVLAAVARGFVAVVKFDDRGAAREVQVF